MTAVCVLNQNTFQCLAERRPRARKMDLHSEALKHSYCKLLGSNQNHHRKCCTHHKKNSAEAKNFILILNPIRTLLVEYLGDKCWQNIFILMRHHLPERSRAALANTSQKADSLQSLAVEKPTRLQKDAGKQATQGCCLLLPWIYMSSQMPELEHWVTPRSWILTADWKDKLGMQLPT